MKFNTKLLVINGLLAGIYAVLTIVLEPISYGAVQFRISEIMTLFAFLNPAYVPGLVLGCVIANLFSPLGIVDVIFGTLATFLALYTMRYFKNIFLASLMPVVFNGLIIGLELFVLFKVPLLASIASVAFGEFVVVSVAGVALYHIGQKFLVSHLKLQ